jgi:hypothetical protein
MSFSFCLGSEVSSCVCEVVPAVPQAQVGEAFKKHNAALQVRGGKEGSVSGI